MKPVRFPSASLPASEHPCACMVCSTQHLLGFRGELCDSCATFLEVAPVLLLLSVRSRLCFSVCSCDEESSTFVDFHGPPRGSCAALHYFAPVLLRLGQRHAGRAGRPSSSSSVAPSALVPFGPTRVFQPLLPVEHTPPVLVLQTGSRFLSPSVRPRAGGLTGLSGAWPRGCAAGPQLAPELLGPAPWCRAGASHLTDTGTLSRTSRTIWARTWGPWDGAALKMLPPRRPRPRRYRRGLRTTTPWPTFPQRRLPFGLLSTPGPSPHHTQGRFHRCLPPVLLSLAGPRPRPRGRRNPRLPFVLLSLPRL